MANVGFATLQIIPSAKDFLKALKKETDAPLAAFSKDSGQAIGDGMAKGAAKPLHDGIAEHVKTGARDGSKAGVVHLEQTFTEGTHRGLLNGFKRGFKSFFWTADHQGRDWKTSLALGVGGGIIQGAKEGFTIAADAAQEFAKSAMSALNAAGSAALSAIGTAVSGAGMTAATGGLNLLIGALLAIVAAIPAVVAGFLALAPVLFLVGGAAGTLFTLLAGGAATAAVFALATHGLSDAFSELSKNGKISNATLKKLTPSARSFVQEIAKLKKPFDELRKVVQERLFEGIGKAVADLAKVWLPALKPMLGDLAGRFNNFAKSIIAALGKPDFIENIRLAVAGFGDFIDRLGLAMGPLIDAFGRLARASVPFLKELGDMIGGVIEKFAKWVKTADESGALTNFMKDAAKTLRDIWNIGGLVVDIAGELIDTFFPSSKKSSDGVLAGLKMNLEAIKKWLQDPANKKKLQDLLDKIAEFIKKAATEWIPKIIEFMGKMDEWSQKIQKVADKVRDIKGQITAHWDGLVAYFKGFPGRVSAALSALPGVVRQWFLNAASAAGEMAGRMVSQSLTMVASLPGRIGNALSSLPGRVRAQFDSARNQGTSSMSWFADQATSIARGLPGRISNAVGNLSGLLWNAGVETIRGFIRGMQIKAPDIVWAIRTFITDRLPDYVKWALGIKSPSKVFMRLGMYVSEGMALGIEKGAVKVTKAANALAAIPGSVGVPDVTVGVGGAGARSARGVTVENLNVRAYSDRFSLSQVMGDLALQGVH